MSTFEEIRQRIAATKSDISAVELQPRSRAEVLAYVQAVVGTWSKRAGDRLAADVQTIAAGGHATLNPPQPVDMLVLVLGADTVTAALRQAVEQHVPKGLDRTARAKKLQALRDTLAALERDEEALLRAAHDSGDLIAPRPDADPWAALEHRTDAHDEG